MLSSLFAESQDLATFEILVDGKVIDPVYQILHISCTIEVSKIAMAQFAIIDGDVASRDFEVSSNDFEPGGEVEIKLGFDGKNETVFKGIISKHAIKIRDQRSMLQIECKGEAIKMTTHRKGAYFYEQDDSSIIQQIIKDAKLSPGPAASNTTTHPELVQFNATDWDFINTRAEANGWLILNNQQGEIAILDPNAASDSEITATYGENIFSFDGTLDIAHQKNTPTAKSWDALTQALSEAEAAKPGLGTTGSTDPDGIASTLNDQTTDLNHSGQLANDEMTNWATAALLRSRIAYSRGRVTMIGNKLLECGTLLKLDGLGKKMNGSVWISGIRHDLRDGNFTSHIQFGLPPTLFAAQPNITALPAAGLLPAACGLQTGVVTKLEGDPDSHHRIQVKLPLVNNDEDGIWCRIATLDAGNERGTFFLPEIGDEVILGFINDDPRDAVVLGMLHSATNVAPLTAADDNHEKGYTSRSGMHLLFDDDKKVITIDTPEGNKVILSEEDGQILIEDQNQNSITLSSDGIDLSSAKDINIKASGDVNIEGINIAIKAQAEIKAEGSAAAEISSSGSTTVKGSIVQIN